MGTVNGNTHPLIREYAQQLSIGQSITIHEHTHDQVALILRVIIALSDDDRVLPKNPQICLF